LPTLRQIAPRVLFPPETVLMSLVHSIPTADKLEVVEEAVNWRPPYLATLTALSGLRYNDISVMVDSDGRPNYLDLNAGAFPGLDKSLGVKVPCRRLFKMKLLAGFTYTNYQLRYKLKLEKPELRLPTLELVESKWVSVRFTGLSANENPDIGPTVYVPADRLAVLTEVGCERATDPQVFIEVDRDDDVGYQSWNCYSMPDLDYSETVWIPAADKLVVRLVNRIALPQFRVRYRYNLYQLTPAHKKAWGIS